ncbi:MAG: saccharopine dehydrogenase C-terminal domain-containing protein [Candidatus Thermoplasmatota archaeon]
MGKVLVLGAGMVSKPLVQYLLNKNEDVVVATRTVSKAKKIIGKHERGKAVKLDISKDKKLLNELISDSDIVVSLLPYVFHVEVAKSCIKNGKHMVTTSYVSEDMMDLDESARNSDIIILNECGLDPGIDHMSAMKIIHDIEKKNGKILSFKSTTGALPSHEANNNPFGYKFSWSPKGVLLASRNSAKWLENDEIVSIPGEKLFENYILQDVPEVGSFENYPNRDSTKYKKIYGLNDAYTVYRGTFRMVGWCETMKAIAEIGWLKDKKPKNFTGESYADLTRYLLNLDDSDGLEEKIAEKLGLKPYSAVIKRLKWLGLFSDISLPEGKNTPLDYLNILTLEKMPLEKNERDMVVMHHEFIADFSDTKKYVTSTLVNYGIPQGDTAVARTVALPAAIAVKMILDGKIKRRGVLRPVEQDVYAPILKELEKMDIKFEEKEKNI